MTQPHTARHLVPARPEFGPYDALAEEAHRDYIAGRLDQAAEACARWAALTRAAGDEVTTRYLHYVRAVALAEGGRRAEAMDAARLLLETLGDEDAPVWRAKALAVVGEASAELNDYAGAVAAMAEADWLVRDVPVGTYGHLSSSMAVALALRSINLLEQADELLRTIRGGGGAQVDVLVTQELALLSVYWGASLLLVGRDQEACPHFVETLSRAARMRRVAGDVGQEQMAARADVIEAYAVMHLGDLPLAAARAEQGAAGFEARRELVETYLLQLVRAQVAVADVEHDRARAILEDLVEGGAARGREMWGTSARAMLAEVHLASLGPHPGLDLWREIARSAQHKVWAEREARFTSLHDRHRLRELTAETRRIGLAVVHDALTGLGNRRMLQEQLDGQDERWAVFVDLDDFKRVNDTWSHAVGDQALRAVAEVLRAQSRRSDVIIRYGGDEFLVLPDGDGDAAVALAQRIRRAVETYPWHTIVDGLQITVSVGVGRGGPGDHLAAADAALLAAKRGGRNRVVLG